jgi:delta14-sterol reductase
MSIDFQPLSVYGVLEAGIGITVLIALLFLGSILLPGRMEEGAARPDGSRQKYKLNGFLLFLLVMIGALAGDWAGLFSLASIPPRLPALFVAANIFAFAASIALMLRGGGRRRLADFFYGVEANPCRWGVDLKIFSYRPSLIGLGLINFSLAALQLKLHGHLAPRMALYQVFCFAYLTNYFQFEYGMLFTWDIVAERLGWMLVWGDYVLVPFFYALPGWYLVNNLEPLPPAGAAAAILLYAGGFWLFRGANGQKNRFKRDANARIWGRPAQSIEGRLLVSGLWGIGRKLNYTGELCMYYAWTLPCGFQSFVPFLVPLWLTIFLPHRAWRDEKRCRAKYGQLWVQYCSQARFRMIPFVY